jgi:MYXO-CTERM domain-containing protein
MTRGASLLSVAIVLALGSVVALSSAQAQRRVQYDTLSESTPAAISCGFCAGEKFGMVFRPLSDGRGLRPEDFPFALNSIEVAVARTQVTGDLFSGYMCQGTAGGGTVSMMIGVYAGETPPSGSIVSMPVTGPWPGESMVFGESADVMLSTETSPGSMMYNVMFNTLDLMGVRVDPPNTYIRVAIDIPGGGTSASCMDLGIPGPGAVGIRDDDGRIDNTVNYIYALNPFGGLGGIAEGWHWNEDPEISDPATGTVGINGEWGIRLNIMPMGTTTPDAGTPMMDAGTPPMIDSGTTPPADSGTSPMCSGDGDCSGGERCVEGMCRRVSCTAASDCAGGMTCVEGMCRNLCASSAECLGGEVCDTAMGYCVPVGSMPDGGCGCRVSSDAAPGWAWLAALPLLGLVLRRRRRR